MTVSDEVAANDSVWGPILFCVTFVAWLGFFVWLL